MPTPRRENRGRPVLHGATIYTPQATCPIPLGSQGVWLSATDGYLYRYPDGTDGTIDTSQVGVVRPAARVAITGALPASTYNATTQTLTANANGVLPAQDGVTLQAGDRVLLAISAASGMGLFDVVSGGAVAAKWSFKRSSDCNTSGDLLPGMLIPVLEGSNAGLWMLRTTGTITLDTTALTFTREPGVALLSGSQTVDGKTLTGVVAVTFAKEATALVKPAQSTTASAAGAAMQLAGAKGADGTALATAGGGGNASLVGGDAGADNGGGGGNGGNAVVDAGAKTGAGTAGKVQIAPTNASAVEIGSGSSPVALRDNTTLAAGKTLSAAAGSGGIDLAGATGIGAPPQIAPTQADPGIPVVFIFDLAAAGSVSKAMTKKVRITEVTGYKKGGAGGVGDTVQVFAGPSPVSNAIDLNVADTTALRATTIDDAANVISPATNLTATVVNGGAGGNNVTCLLEVRGHLVA